MQHSPLNKLLHLLSFADEKIIISKLPQKDDVFIGTIPDDIDSKTDVKGFFDFVPLKTTISFSYSDFESQNDFLSELKVLHKEALYEFEEKLLTAQDPVKYRNYIIQRIEKILSVLPIKKSGGNYEIQSDKSDNICIIKDYQNYQEQLPEINDDIFFLKEVLILSYTILQNLKARAVPIFNEGIEDEFGRIKCRASKEQIKEFFMRLADTHLRGEVILSEEDVNKFLHANFALFYPYKPLEVKLKLNAEKGQIRHFIYEFWVKYDNYQSADKYAHLLKDNFTTFEETMLSTIKGHFSVKPKNPLI